MTVTPILFALALAESPFMPDNPQSGAASPRPAPQAMCTPARKLAAEKAEARARGARAVARLPESYGKSFRTLDGYLIHLECFAAPVDAPWWQQVSPGVYRQVTTAPNARLETATRAQLLKRFGFRR